MTDAQSVRADAVEGARVVDRERRSPADRKERGRIDARSKATGQSIYTADVDKPGELHVAVQRSSLPHARIVSIDSSLALASKGVFGVYTAEDLTAECFGRNVRDTPVLARGVARFVGEPVAAVLASSRRLAEKAASLIDVEYEELPAVTTPDEALAPGASLVHEEPWKYPNAVIKPEDGGNLQSIERIGDREMVEAALAASATVIDHVYETQAMHQGYIEPQAALADYENGGKIHLWSTNKSPYALRRFLSAGIAVEPPVIDIEPITLGGDFGGKGAPGLAPLCIELSRVSGRPVKHMLRYSDDLIATNPRHPSRIRVRLGCDEDGRLTALLVESVLDGGAYAGFKPAPNVILHGIVAAPEYRIPAFYTECKFAYTNTVPKGHMRAPGAPQMTFAFESALDELAIAAHVDPAEMRRRNLLVDGEQDANGHIWLEWRGRETLAAALEAYRPQPVPEGWLAGTGIAIYARQTTTAAMTSLCLIPIANGRVRAEIPIVETGTGVHTTVREMLANGLGLAAEDVEIVQVSTGELPQDSGVGGSRKTAEMSLAVDAAVKAWQGRLNDSAIQVVVDETASEPVGSYGVQIAQVAVDPETGELRVLEILSALDVAEIINPVAHQMQIDGGTTQGFGYGVLEDLDESDGQVWAANLGEFKIPSSRDVPIYRTVLVPGGRGVGTSNVKSIGETTTPPVAPAIANAVAQATGCRIRSLPITPERIYQAMQEKAHEA